MKVFFYGTRGSIPTPLLLKEYKSKIKKILELYNKTSNKNVNKFISSLPFNLSHIYGGNTACVVLKEESVNNNHHIIIDAGSGIRNYGNEIKNVVENTFHIFISHFHWDHICGLPFFKPIYNPKNKIIFYSAFDNTLQRLQRLFHSEHFPVTFDALPVKKEIIKISENSDIDVLGFKIKAVSLKHPGGAYAFVFNGYGKKFSYITDAEFTQETLENNSNFYKKIFENSDIAIMDSQYHVIEFFNKFDWGHTSTNMAVNIALDWNIKRLVMFHFDPDHSDDDLVKILKEAKEQKDFLNKDLMIFQAIEGTYIDF